MLFSAPSLEVWTLCLDLTLLHLISHFFTCLHVLISSSSLLIDFFSRFPLFVSSSHCSVTSRFCFNRVSILSSHNLSCVLRMCDTLSSNLLLFCFVLMYARFVSLFSTTSCTYMYFSITCFILPSPLLDAHAFADLLSTWFMRITSRPNSCKRCFVTIPSATPVVRALYYASAELKLTVCCVRDHAVSVAFLHCTTPPLVLLHVVACPAQSLSVYTFTNFGGVMISIRLFAPRSAFAVSHNTLQIHLVALGWTCNFSCSFLHAVHDVCSLLAHVQ